MQKQTAKTDNF